MKIRIVEYEIPPAAIFRKEFYDDNNISDEKFLSRYHKLYPRHKVLKVTKKSRKVKGLK